jgi:hypothetical protein
MLRINPTGRTPRTARPLTVVKLVPPGKEWLAPERKTHVLNRETGTLLCMPRKSGSGDPATGRGKTLPQNIVPTHATQVTCMRCAKLLTINQTLRKDDLAVGDAAPLVKAARAARRR